MTSNFLILLGLILVLFYSERSSLLPFDPTKCLRFAKDHWILLIPYGLIAYGQPILEWADGLPRHVLTYVTTRSAYYLLKLLGYHMIPSPDPYVLMTMLYRAKIGGACSGLDGITFFVAAFSCVLIADGRDYSKKTIIATYAAGIAYMLFLNVLRISLIVAAGNWAVEKWGTEEGGKYFMDLFHGNLGWVSYSVGIGLFFLVFFKCFGKKRVSG